MRIEEENDSEMRNGNFMQSFIMIERCHLLKWYFLNNNISNIL